MKRFFGLLLIVAVAVVSLCGTLTVASAEQNDVKLNLDVQKEGDEVVATVYLTENDGIADLYLRVEYDEDALELIKSEFGSNAALSSLSPMDNFEEGGYEYPYRLQYIGNENSTDTGRLVTLTFHIKSGTPDGDYDVRLIVREVASLAGDHSVDLIHNEKYGEPLTDVSDVDVTKQGGLVVAEKTVVISGGTVQKIEDADAPKDKGRTALLIGLIVGGSALFIALFVGAYLIYRQKRKQASESNQNETK